MKRLNLVRYFAPVSTRLEAVEAELSRILQSDVAVVHKLAQHVGKGQGKRLRPALVLLACRFCGLESQEDVRFGAVFELVHTATLTHDDVIDHAQTRRSRPTLNALWGNTLTVLFGDLLYMQSMTSAIAGRSFRMLEILANVTTRMIEGELIQNDVLYSLQTTRQDYFDIQERKTALLFAGCVETGAVPLRRYGLEIGRAFQLIDDLLDYTATSEQLGKPAFSDLHEGKLTLPMLTLLERAPEQTRPLVQRVWKSLGNEPMTPEDEATLRKLIQQHDVLAETRELAKKATQAALEALATVQGDKAIRKLLMEIPEMLLERSR